MPTFKKNTSAFKMKSPVKFWKNIQQMYNMGKNIGSKLGLTKKPKYTGEYKDYTTESGKTYKMDSATHSFYSNNPMASKYLNLISEKGVSPTGSYKKRPPKPSSSA